MTEITLTFLRTNSAPIVIRRKTLFLFFLFSTHWISVSSGFTLLQIDVIRNVIRQT